MLGGRCMTFNDVSITDGRPFSMDRGVTMTERTAVSRPSSRNSQNQPAALACTDETTSDIETGAFVLPSLGPRDCAPGEYHDGQDLPESKTLGDELDRELRGEKSDELDGS